MSHYQKSFFFLSSQSGKIDEEYENYCKISKLILDVLTPVVRNWLETHIKSNNIDAVKQYNKNISYLNQTQRTLEKYGNEFLNGEKYMIQFPSNFNIFDLTACAEMGRNLLPNMQLSKDASIVDRIKDIKWGNDLKEKNAIYYSKVIKNEFQSHIPMSKIANNMYKEIFDGLELIFEKLETSPELILIKNEILACKIIDGKKIEEIIKLIQEESHEWIEFVERETLNSILKEKKLYFVTTSNIYLTCLHVQQILKGKTSMTFKFDDFVTIQTPIRDLMEKDNEIILVIECNNKNTEMVNTFEFSHFEQFHVVIISIDGEKESIKNDEYTFNDFTKETQHKLLENRKVMFQGKVVLLKSLVSNFNIPETNMNGDCVGQSREIFTHLNSMLLEVLIKNENVFEIFKQDESNFDEFSKYYISRKFKRFVQIERKHFENENNKEKRFKIVYTEEDFTKSCQENSKESIHFLEKSENDQFLIWRKSRGPISDLNSFLIKKENSFLSIDEGKILDQNESILIISADPGMGKSTILDNLVHVSNLEIFFIKIILNNHTTVLKKIKDKQIKIEDHDIMDLVLKAILNKNNVLEIAILKYLAKKEKLIVMFDGVDEVVDYKEQVKTIIKALNENYKIKKILITTRNHLRIELENYFETISFNLINFEYDDQIKFLVKFWKNFNKNLEEQVLKNSAKRLITKLKSTMTNNIDQLIGIPLQTKMIADIYLGRINSENDYFDESLEINNISDLYHEFVEKKFNRQFQEKLKIDPVLNHELCEREKDLFYEDHIKYSLMILFKKTNLNDSNNETEQKRIKKFGIIVNFKNKTPIFLHQSYAEYFLAKQALNIINETPDKKDEEFDQILTKRDFFLVRKFLDFLLLQTEFKMTYRSNTKSEKQEQIDNCCRENLVNILNYLIEIENVNIKSNNQFLLLASEEGNKETVQFLIEKGIDINQINKDGNNALHLATKKGHKEIVRLLIEKGIDINQIDWIGRNGLHLASFYGQKAIVQLLIEKGIGINQTNKDGYNALHWASWNGKKEIAQLLIEKGIDINQTNKDGYNALHIGAYNGYKEIVQFLIEKGIDINETKKNGWNALHFIYYQQKEIFKLLEEKGIFDYDGGEGEGDMFFLYDNYEFGIMYGHKQYVNH